MSGHQPQPLAVEGVPQLWLRGDGPPAAPYRPAVLVECKINFRSLRAELNHSEERSYAAWLPEGDLAIDWDQPAANIGDGARLVPAPEPGAAYHPGNYTAGREDFERFEAELINKLVRSERLKVFFNPVFDLYSSPDDPLDQFLAQVGEAALARVEPELKRLRNRFELQLEQIREARSVDVRAEEFNLESFMLHKLQLFESENRMAAMFSTLAGAVFGTTGERPPRDIVREDVAELREDLDRIEQEASQALRELYDQYLQLASEHDVYEIGLQPDNIQVMRRALLWVPVAE